MGEAGSSREIQATIRPSESSPPPRVANVFLVNHIGETFVLDFGFLDPLGLPSGSDAPVEATHIGKIVMARDTAMKLRAELNRIFGEA